MEKYIPDSIDQEAWTTQDSTVNRYKDAIFTLMDTYGFLTKVFFAGHDGTGFPVIIKSDDRLFEVDGEELLRATLPPIITKLADRLFEMSEADSVISVSDMIASKWGDKT